MIWNAFVLALREIRNNILRASLTTLGIVMLYSASMNMDADMPTPPRYFTDSFYAFYKRHCGVATPYRTR